MAGTLTLSTPLTPPICSPAVIPAIDFDLFGGGKFSLEITGEAPAAIAARALHRAAAALSFMAPLKPMMGIVSGLVKIVTSLASVPPDIVGAVQGIQQIGVETSTLAQLIFFPVQLVRTVRGVLRLLVFYLESQKAAVTALVNRYATVNALIAQAQSLGNAALLANATCAKERLDAKVAQINAELAGLGVVMQLFSILLCLLSGGHLEPLPTLNAGALVAEVFDPPIAVLNALLLLIPDAPGVAMSC